MDPICVIGLLVRMLRFPVHDLLQQEPCCIVNVAVILCRCPEPTNYANNNGKRGIDIVRKRQ